MFLIFTVNINSHVLTQTSPWSLKQTSVSFMQLTNRNAFSPIKGKSFLSLHHASWYSSQPGRSAEAQILPTTQSTAFTTRDAF